jgi:hypothetical protein
MFPNSRRASPLKSLVAQLQSALAERHALLAYTDASAPEQHCARACLGQNREHANALLDALATLLPPGRSSHLPAPRAPASLLVGAAAPLAQGIQTSNQAYSQAPGPPLNHSKT